MPIGVTSYMGEKGMHEVVSKPVKFFKDSVVAVEGHYDIKKCICLRRTSTCVPPKWHQTTPSKAICAALLAGAERALHGRYLWSPF